MERFYPVTPDMRPCNNGCPLYGEVATFGDGLAGQINAAQDKLTNGDESAPDDVSAEALRCAHYRVQRMCITALGMTIVCKSAAGWLRPGRKLESADIAPDNPYL